MATNKRLIKSNDEGGAGGASFNTVLYTGENPSYPDVTGVGFTPDLVWIKNRDSSGENHSTTDVVSGFGKILYPNLTLGQGGSDDYLVSQIPDGFSVNTDNQNGSGVDYVAWCWKAAGYDNTFNVLENGSTTSSATAAGAGITAGSITTGWSVSANRDAGFSIFTFTTPGGSAWVDTIGHGLNEAPQIFITKARTQTGNWWTFTNLITPNPAGLQLNTTNEAVDTDSIQSGISFNTSTIGANKAFFQGGFDSQNLVVYAFHSVPGFSKFGSYTGGTANNPIALGFEPAFVMIKSYSGVEEQWVMYDNKRSTSNPRNDLLFANLSNAESVNNVNQEINFDDNGFTLVTTNSATNVSGASYIYMAFANQF
jgi:hypothetical protein